jgi:molecular chaperone GrpE (heat shock protein)
VDTYLESAAVVSDGTVEPLHPALGDPPTIDRLLDGTEDGADGMGDADDPETGPWDDVPTISEFPAILTAPAPPAMTAVTPVAPLSALPPSAPAEAIDTLPAPPELLREIREQVRSEVLTEVREAVWKQARAATLQETWEPLVERLVELYAELERNDAAMTGGADSGRGAASELSRHMRLRLQEVLARGGVTVLSDGERFDRARHEPPPGTPVPPDGTPITRFLSPAFLVDGRVLRRARVEVAGAAASGANVAEGTADGAAAVASLPPANETATTVAAAGTPDLPHDEDETEGDGDTLEVPPLTV